MPGSWQCVVYTQAAGEFVFAKALVAEARNHYQARWLK